MFTWYNIRRKINQKEYFLFLNTIKPLNKYLSLIMHYTYLSFLNIKNSSTFLKGI